MKNKGSYLTGIILLALTAFIWGAAFVVQSDAMNEIGPITFTAMRSLLGGTVLIPIYLVTSRKNFKEPFLKENRNDTLRAGVFCGVVLYFSMNVQQVGLISTSPGKGGFITALYIIFVPIIGCFLHKPAKLFVWISAVVAVFGFYLMNIRSGEGFSIGFGEIMILLCSVALALHIIAIEHFGRDINAALLSSMQFIVAGVLSLLTAFLDNVLLGYPTVTLEAIGNVWINIAYLGIGSSGVGYTLQILGQKRTPAVVASLIMSLESVFSALIAWLVLDEALEKQQLIGCGLIMAAIIIAQLPFGGATEKEKINTSPEGDDTV